MCGPDGHFPLLGDAVGALCPPLGEVPSFNAPLQDLPGIVCPPSPAASFIAWQSPVNYSSYARPSSAPCLLCDCGY